MTKKKRKVDYDNPDFRLRFARRRLMWKVRWMMFCLNLRVFLIRRFHCDRGYHKIKHCSHEIGHNGRCVFRVEYHHCPYCSASFFSNKKDMKKYNNMIERESKVQWKIMDALLKDAKIKVKGEVK